MNEDYEIEMMDEQARKIKRDFYIACFATVPIWGFCLYAFLEGHTFLASALAIVWPIAALKSIFGRAESASVKAAKAAVGFYAGYKGGGGLT